MIFFIVETSILKSYCQGLLAFILYTKIVAVKGRKKRELVPENLWDFLEDLDINLIHGKCMLFRIQVKIFCKYFL